VLERVPLVAKESRWSQEGQEKRAVSPLLLLPQPVKVVGQFDQKEVVAEVTARFLPRFYIAWKSPTPLFTCCRWSQRRVIGRKGGLGLQRAVEIWVLLIVL
jgi:hypothetical protein